MNLLTVSCVYFVPKKLPLLGSQLAFYQH